MTRWVCVHGHFYQPPRENPWLEVVEPQPSARPYPDWNARITAECYRPNAAARIVDGGGRIVRILDNYERMSFNFGPTLMTWLEREAPDVHAAVVEADRKSRTRFGGHGSAMAQAYNHLIMPLANRRDKVTQVRWGVADFRHRFGRAPEGMWLPECAVDVETLEVLAEEGLGFTVLAPGQAARWRPFGAGDDGWKTGAIDTGRVYRARLPSGRALDLYFYDGAASQAVAFERLLADGGALAARLVGAGKGGALSHIATDGETYGHHHRYGDMALAWALHTIEAGTGGARLTNYAEFRARFPAGWEAEVVAPSAWSCAHGVDRWRADCGCNTGAGNGWNQAWRAPLRAALDWLRDRAAVVFEGAGVFRDPWAARDDYIAVVLDRRATTIDALLSRHLAVPADGAVRQRALELLEQQRHAMLMYTSCGWFFDDLAGIETVQVLQYAARVCELTARATAGADQLEPGFVDLLAAARSNRPEAGDGRAVWDSHVAPARVGLSEIVAHVAVSVLVDGAAAAAAGPALPPGVAMATPVPGTLAQPALPGIDAAPEPTVFCYDVTFLDRMERRAGKARLVAGMVEVRCRITLETGTLCFAGLHLGEHNLVGGVRSRIPDDEWRRITAALGAAFATADLVEAQRAIDRSFPDAAVSLGSLRGGDRDRVIQRILAEPLGAVNTALARIYDEYAPLMRWLRNHHLPVPDAFHTAAEYTLRRRLLHNLASPAPSFAEVVAQIGEATQVEVTLDTPDVAYVAGLALAGLVDRLVAHPDDVATLEAAARAAEVASRMKSPVDLWHAQNAGMQLVEAHLVEWRSDGDPASAAKARWLTQLAAALRLATPP